MKSPHRCRSVSEGLSRSAEITASNRERGVAAFLFSPAKEELEFVYRRDLSLQISSALDGDAGRELLAWARRTPRSHLLRRDGLASRVPALFKALSQEEMGGLALFPLLGDDSVLGYVVLGLAVGEATVPKASGAAWRESNGWLSSMRREAGRSVLRGLLALHQEGLARGLQALVVVDQEDRVLFSHGVSRLLPAWGRGEAMGQHLRGLPGGRVLAGSEATGSGHFIWRKRKVSAGGVDYSLGLAVIPVHPEWEGRGNWRAVLVREGEPAAEDSDGGVLLELALRLNPGEGHQGQEVGITEKSLVRGALAAADKVSCEESIDFSGLFRGFLHRLEPELRDDRIQVLPFLQADLPLIRGDRRFLETALWAVLRKAWASLLPRGGTITLRTWEEEGSVWCTIADDGEGIEDWSMQELLSLEPLLSPRGAESLPESGLDMARELIRAGGGTFHVETRPRLWTRYSVVFSSERVVKRAGLGTATGIPPAVEVRRNRSGRLEVLVVDDNEMVRTVLRKYLERKGHAVTEAIDGGVALRILEERAFDTVMVDIDMPGTTGVEFFQRLEGVNPGMRDRTVFMTGGFQEGDTEDFIQGTGRPHIQKPFDLREISEVLRG